MKLQWKTGGKLDGPTRITLSYRWTLRNFLAARVSRVVHHFFGEEGLAWCLNHLFHGRVWIRSSVEELRGR